MAAKEGAVSVEHSDEWLAARWAAGDRAASALLVSRYYQPLLNLFYRLTGSRSEAEDLVQETWVRALRSLQEPREVAVRPWLYRIATNLWRDEARKHGRRRQRGLAAAPLPADLPAPAPDDVSGAVEQTQTRAWVRAAVLRLSLPHQQVLMLRYYQKLSYEEIAAVAAVPVGTVRSRLHHALIHLRKQLHGPVEGGTAHG